ncbi:receptor kinase-like protein Xa21 [Rosa chinensis]|uniref:receptor kinase-like protein Xa21 n=1 Tax=Rosa chinensis TaxID=74649 RepID=UPI001AD8CA22|nr:receptor kinase-like protein Xa21 [Rosa chinensis]
MGLQGTIAPHVGNLSFLVSLDLRNNSFSGFLPNEISHLHRLKVLMLHANQLEGNIPPTLYRCEKLELISLAINKLSGHIPKELGFLPRLEQLLIGNNNFSGGVPPILGNISTLEVLNMSYNGLTGSLPSSLFNLSSLVTFSVEQNHLSGSFHDVDVCHSWPRLQFLSLVHNNFSGQLPYFRNCTELVILYLSFNKFVGKIPADIGNLQNLEELYLSFNSLTGTIPPSIGNLSSLRSLLLRENNLKGSIPRDSGRLSRLVFFVIRTNGLSGPVPLEIFNISSLQVIEAKDNALSGKFPSSSAVRLPSIGFITLSHNKITGHVPSYFANFTKLYVFQVTSNFLYGPIPKNFGSLNHLENLLLGGNQLTGDPGVPTLDFLSSLFNGPSLKRLVLSENPLNGTIPNSFGNSSSPLQFFWIDKCQIKGHIPKGIGSLKSLTYLLWGNNNLSGNIPESIGGLERLQRLYLGNNSLEGCIPDELCLLRNLGELSLQNNKISESIPNCIGNLNLLQKVFLSSNRLTSSVPLGLWDLENLLFLDLSINSFYGNLPPSLSKLNAIQEIDLSQNQFTGNIPSTIGSLQTLSSLNLSQNFFTGSVPQTFGDQLKGGPFWGRFVNFNAQSFLENKALCGRREFGLPPCKTHRTQKSKVATRLLAKYVLPAIASTLILIALCCMLTRYGKRKRGKTPSSVEQLTTVEHIVISYQELRRATNDFCESNLLGVGSFGSVYKGILSNGTTIAVKVLKLEMEGAVKSFDAECKVWRTIRHRNLVKVITTCSSPEVSALVLQYMSNGSLEKWLYSHNYCLSILQRVSMLIDIASALEYLHHGQAEAVVHCDVKPGNILLDEDMVAHVADFGLAKNLAKNKEETQTRTIGTLGYVAPEYGSAGKVSKKGDVYSFGIMLLEIMARKKPTDEMFAGEVTLRQWINVSIPDNVLEVVDAGLLSIEEGRDMNATESILVSILEIGLTCSEEVAEDRMDIKDVVPKLKKIKLALQH